MLKRDNPLSLWSSLFPIFPFTSFFFLFLSRILIGLHGGLSFTRRTLCSADGHTHLYLQKELIFLCVTVHVQRPIARSLPLSLSLLFSLFVHSVWIYVSLSLSLSPALSFMSKKEILVEQKKKNERESKSVCTCPDVIFHQLSLSLSIYLSPVGCIYIENIYIKIGREELRYIGRRWGPSFCLLSSERFSHCSQQSRRWRHINENLV